jgi:hypothetical protein
MSNIHEGGSGPRIYPKAAGGLSARRICNPFRKIGHHTVGRKPRRAETVPCPLILFAPGLSHLPRVDLGKTDPAVRDGLALAAPCTEAIALHATPPAYSMKAHTSLWLVASSTVASLI